MRGSLAGTTATATHPRLRWLLRWTWRRGAGGAGRTGRTGHRLFAFRGLG